MWPIQRIIIKANRNGLWKDLMIKQLYTYIKIIVLSILKKLKKDVEKAENMMCKENANAD